MDGQDKNEETKSDEMNNLERLHLTMKRERAAWKKLLEKLEELRTKNAQE